MVSDSKESQYIKDNKKGIEHSLWFIYHELKRVRCSMSRRREIIEHMRNIRDFSDSSVKQYFEATSNCEDQVLAQQAIISALIAEKSQLRKELGIDKNMSYVVF